MADFRRCILALAVVALLTGLVSTASAQPFTCNATAAVPTLMRSEGLTELAGDIVLQCHGVLPAGSDVRANFSVFLGNTTITSRILDTATNASEVLLLVDEPNTGGTSLGFCLATTTGAGACNKNVFQGVISANQVTFLAVPVIPGATVSDGSVIDRVFRITNVRANASAVGVGASGTPGQVTAFVAIVGPTSIPVNNAQQTVGFVQKGLNFSVRATSKPKDNQASAGTRSIDDLTFAQCASRGSSSRVNPVAALRFAENFATAFKPRQAFVGGVVVAQATPGAIYNSESGLMVPGIGGTQLTGFSAAAGQADFGTKLRAVFNNIPNGLNIWVSASNIINDLPATSSSTIQAVAVSSDVAASVFPGGTGAVVPSATFKNANGDTDAIPVVQVSLTGGTGTVIWEVLRTDPFSQEFADFDLYYGYTANPASNSPAVGTGTVAGTFAPTSTVATASATAPIPRFADTASAINVVAIVACRTNLLFPFVTNQAGFDTGIAIANTTKDIFGTSAQAGTCTLNFFGSNAPAPITTASIAGGDTFTLLAQTSSPNFQGYIIAQCQFQFGHGFAFVQSSVGYNPTTAAMGYLALVIPDQTDNSRSRNAINISGSGELLGQ